MTIDLLEFSPSRSLAPYVAGYWYLKDLAGEYRGRPIRTIPSLRSVLTVNVGHPNRRLQDFYAPRVSVLGIQTHPTIWVSDVDTQFIMAVLTPKGLISLFPHDSGRLVDTFVDLGAVAGDAWMRALATHVARKATPAEMARVMDETLLRRLSQHTLADTARLESAMTLLKDGRRVDFVADQIGLSRRHLGRLFKNSLGVSPKTFATIARIGSSTAAFQANHWRQFDGFSDQSHQIREWKRHMDMTPGQYRNEGLSPMAHRFWSDAAFFL